MKTDIKKTTSPILWWTPSEHRYHTSFQAQRHKPMAFKYHSAPDFLTKTKISQRRKSDQRPLSNRAIRVNGSCKITPAQQMTYQPQSDFFLFFKLLRQKVPKTKVFVTFHDFRATPMINSQYLAFFRSKTRAKLEMTGSSKDILWQKEKYWSEAEANKTPPSSVKMHQVSKCIRYGVSTMSAVPQYQLVSQ